MIAALKRRAFITLIGGAAAAWPLAARAQRALALVGYLHSATPGPFVTLTAAFLRGLSDMGYVEGQNVTIEYRWTEGQVDRLPGLAADLVRNQVAVLVAVGGELSARAAKAATSSIPIVFSVGGDPIKSGLVASFNHPGGNMTGLSYLTESLTPSARASSMGGTSRPSAFAVLRLMISSNRVGCTTGRSAAFAPLSMRPA
jgi:putative ABC transport system substrate-binding protein